MAPIPLVRTDGKSFPEGYLTLGHAELSQDTPLLVESRSDRTRAAEGALELGACTDTGFFYGVKGRLSRANR